MAAAAVALLLLLGSPRGVPSFAPPPPSSISARPRAAAGQRARRVSSVATASPSRSWSALSAADGDGADDVAASDEEVEPVLGNNWMKPSPSVDFSPASMSGSTGTSASDESIYVDVGIGGIPFGTGDLSRRMHEALMKVANKKFPFRVPGDLTDVYFLYAMDCSAKEAVKAAMDGNGYVLNLGEDESLQDEGAWGRVSDVMLLDSSSGEPTRGRDGATSYESFADAVGKGGWEPGEPYSFVVREVPARKKAMDLEALLRALDPDGALWDEAKERGLIMPGDEIGSLAELRGDCEQRVNSAPTEATDEVDAYRGGTSKGYDVVGRGRLRKEGRDEDGSEDRKTLLHVMDSLANHGCLIVDLTDGDEVVEDATKMSEMWEATETFFDAAIGDGDAARVIPPMQRAEGVGSTHAMVGFASFKDGDNQFLETRIRRSDGTLLPEETSSIVGDDGAKAMVDAFGVMAEVGRDIVRIATAASSVEADAFVTVGAVVSSDEGSPSIAGLSFDEASASGILEEDGAPSEEDVRRAEILASDAAVLLAEEILDDGRPLIDADVEHDEGPVSMSPHRMCRYSNDAASSSSKKKRPSECFGAHTDTSFVTIVPAAKVSGLEVFDEDALRWYRPELNARKHAKGLDPGGDTADGRFPWHARYLIVMPGELLQLTSRNNVPAAVHRVVAAADVPRLSAPVLLRARPGTKMDVERYMGNLEKADSLLLESNGMRMEEIHDALQPEKKQ